MSEKKENESAQEPENTVQAPEAENIDYKSAFAEMAALDSIDYDHWRGKAAQQLGIRTSTLDAEVAKVRQSNTGSTVTASGSALVFKEPEPWPEKVDGAELLNDLKNLFKQYASLSDEATTAIALWVILTYLVKGVSILPILILTSPQMRCGKTTVLILLELLVRLPLSGSHITPAAMFRAIEKWQPTLLIDEADTFLKDNHALRGIINSGHTRATAHVIRTVGDDHEPHAFNTFTAKVIALIGSTPATITDRAIVIKMRRKRQAKKLKDSDWISRISFAI